ncbi:hypothetical protein [Pseudomonas fluorescens]|uniref:Uncharacterized protein n=1 Tax=Pseudomonas fluorescens TaxID=294 RepID=A0A5E6QJR4_PSEFL|nr:hypothetical protein [Pseudomonas fluorescens]VVM52505.1 hypothetical protein PS655_00860 [Pseudomonas fluorescens]
MTIQEVPVSELHQSFPLALNPPTIPAAVANGGLRWQDLNDPSSPVQVQIVLQPGSVLLNDFIDLMWLGKRVAGDAVNADHLSTGIVTLSVAPADILEHPDGLHTVEYTVTAAIGDQTEPSPPATVKVKRLLPGGNTGDDAGTEYINENLQAPTGIPALIDDAIAELGITVTVPAYENMAVGDLPQLDFGGLRIPHAPLTEAEVGRPVTFRVEKATLIAAPGRVIVRYDIRDVVNNWSRWSLHASTDVEAGENLLAAPRVLDAIGGEIDLARLGDKDARVQTPVFSERMSLGDLVKLTWAGVTAVGLPVEVQLEKKVEEEDIGWPLDFNIPNDKVRAIAQGNAVVRYEVTFLSGSRLSSRRTTVAVIGQVELLPAPIVAGVVGDVLDPTSLPPEGALVRIDKHFLINAGDTLLLLWEGKTANGTSLTHSIPIPVTGSGAENGVERRVPLIYITPLQGGTVTVSFTLNKNGGASLQSDKLPLQVKSLGVNLPKPTIDYAQGETLDPEAVPADGTTIRVNYTMETGDRIDAHLDGVLDFTDWFPVPANWNSKEVEFLVDKNYVDLNKDQNVQVFYIVTRGGQPLPPSEKQSLLIGSAVELEPPRIKEANGNSLNPFAAKDTLTAVVTVDQSMIGAQLNVTWAGTAGGGSNTTTPVPVTALGDMDIPLPNSVVAFNLNKPVSVIYNVIRNGTPKPSKPLILAVQPIADGDPNLPTPTIDGAVGNTLDVRQVDDSAQLRIDEWLLQALNQNTWLDYKGTDKNGNAVELLLLAGAAHQQASGLVTAARVAWLRELKDGSALTITFRVNFDKVSNASNAVSFPQARLTIRNLLVGGSENWNDEPLRRLPLNVITKFKSGLEITPTVDYGDGTYIITWSSPPTVNALGIYEMCRTRFKLAEDYVSNISITLRIEESSNPHKIRFYDREVLIEELNLPATVPAGPFNYKAPIGRRFNFFEIWTVNSSAFRPGMFIIELKWFD